MICGRCPYTDGMIYTSLPPKVKCTITGEFHLCEHVCNCRNARKVKENLDRYKAEKNESRQSAFTVEDSGLTVLNGTADAISATIPNDAVTEGATNVASIFDCVAEIGFPCMICGDSIPTDFVYGGPKICTKCKKAVMYIREKLEKAERCEAIYD